MRREINTKNGAPPIGPYSQAIVADGPMLFISGQGPVDPDTGENRFGEFREQAELAFQNVTTLLEAAGSSWAHVVKVSVFLADMANFGVMNEIYQQHLVAPFPVRTTVQVGLPAQMEIEVDCIARVPQE